MLNQPNHDDNLPCTTASQTVPYVAAVVLAHAALDCFRVFMNGLVTCPPTHADVTNYHRNAAQLGMFFCILLSFIYITEQNDVTSVRAPVSDSNACRLYEFGACAMAIASFPLSFFAYEQFKRNANASAVSTPLLNNDEQERQTPAPIMP
jgi:hypothetical protein